MTSPLLDLPVEILLQIGEHLPPPDCSALCQTHSRLRSLVQSLVDSRIHLTWTISHPPRIVQLVQRLRQRPERGHLVQHLTLSGETDSSESPVEEGLGNTISITESDAQDLAEYTHQLDLPDSLAWIGAIRNGAVDALVAVLLTQLPHLVSLQLSKNWTRETRFIGFVFRLAACEAGGRSQCPSFNDLQDVSLDFFIVKMDFFDYEDFEDEARLPSISRPGNASNTADILPLFYFPSIKRIATPIDDPGEFTWADSHPPNASQITSLNLAWIKEENLTQILSVTKGLQRLSWTWLNRHGWDPDIFDIDRIVSALSPIRDTLTHLTIRTRAEQRLKDEWDPNTDTRGGPFTVLASLHMLEVLEVPIPEFLAFGPLDSAHGNLPPRLRCLTFNHFLGWQRQYNWTHLETMKDLRFRLPHYKKCAPQLERFGLYTYLPGCTENIWRDDWKRGVTSVGERIGVQVHFVEPPFTHFYDMDFA